MGPDNIPVSREVHNTNRLTPPQTETLKEYYTYQERLKYKSMEILYKISYKTLF